MREIKSLLGIKHPLLSVLVQNNGESTPGKFPWSIWRNNGVEESLEDDKLKLLRGKEGLPHVARLKAHSVCKHERWSNSDQSLWNHERHGEHVHWY